MAINTDPLFSFGQNLTPEQTAQMHALKSPLTSQMNTDGYLDWSGGGGSLPGKWGPSISFDPAQVLRGTSVGADAEYMNDPSGAGTWGIYQPRNISNFGASDVTGVWNDDGTWNGYTSGMGDWRGLAMIAAAALGGAYMNGGFGAESAVGGASGTAGASGIANASNGAFLGEGVSSGIGAWDAAAIKSAALSGELGTAASYVGQNLSNGTMFDTARSLAGDTLSNLSDANSVKNATDAGSKGMNWLDVVNTAATVYGITKAGDASSDATDAAKTVADRQLDLNEESLNWFKQVYADQAPDRTAAAQRANAISDAQLRGMTFATDQAQELDQYNKTTFRPVEQRLVADAQGYDTEGRRESAAQEASGRVASEFDTTRQSAGREMIRYGVDPSTIAALDASSQIDEAKARAGAGNTARTNVEQQGWSRMADVANMGRGIASQQATQQGIATTTGNSSVANSNSALANTQSGNGLMAQGFQNANQGNQIAGSMFNNVARSQQADDQMLLTGVNGITNYLGNRYGTSDPKVKKGTGRMANAAQALKEVEATPVHDGWEYDESKGAPPGSGGKKMTGPMAPDVQRISGEASAPGGKQIDLVKQQGRMMAAIQQLAKDVRALKKHETEPEKEAA